MCMQNCKLALCHGKELHNKNENVSQHKDTIRIKHVEGFDLFMELLFEKYLHDIMKRGHEMKFGWIRSFFFIIVIIAAVCMSVWLCMYARQTGYTAKFVINRKSLSDDEKGIYFWAQY